MIYRRGLYLLAAGALFAGLALAQEPPAPGEPEEPPVRLKKKNKPDTDKTDPAKPPMKEEKKDPPKKEEGKEEANPTPPPEEEAEVLQRVAKNVRLAEEKLSNKELGDGTRQLQDDILKDLDALIHSAENPPPSGGGGGSDDKQDPSGKDSQSKQNGGSGGKQSSGKSGGMSSRAARRQQQGNGSQQANKGNGKPGSPGNDPEKGEGSSPQASKTGGGNKGGDDKTMEGPNKNADLYKDVWGHLPESLRAEMNAYSNDKQFMAKYDELIKRYYRSIAEEGRK